MLPKPPIRHLCPRTSARQRGMTLIELMVTMVIGLLLTLAMVSALVYGEAQKRTTNAIGDMDQSGAYAASVLDTALRNAGSGLMQTLVPVNMGVIGCNPGFTGTGLPVPFDQLLGGDMRNLSIAPMLIAANPSGADVLVVMSGSGAAGGLPRAVVSAAGNTVRLNSTVGIGLSSQMLVNQPGGGCSIQTVDGNDLAGATLTLSPGLAAGSPSLVLPLGNQAVGDVRFELLGVDPNTATLYSYDLLTNHLQPLASNVVMMRALYGVADVGGQLQWHAAAAPLYGFEALSANPPPAALNQIVAVRVALVLKGSLYEKDPVSAGKQLTWFNTGPDNVAVNGLAAESNTWTPAADSPDEHYRYRVMEFVVPMRNSMIANAIS